MAVLGAFAVVTVLLTVVVTVAARAVPITDAVRQGPAWLDAWFQYDSGWYYGIAANGYFYVPGQQSSIAFFPVYPMAVRGVGTLLGDYQVAGSLIAVLAGAGVVVLFGRWAWQRLPRPAALTALAILMLYPYAIYLYGAMYADSVFMLATLGAFLLLEQRLYWLAGLVGALATAGRPVGIAVAIGLVIRMLELRAQDRARQVSGLDPGETGAPGSPGGPSTAISRPGLRDLLRAVPTVRWREAGVLLSGAGIVGWCLFLWIEFGNPVAFVAAESAPGWDQGVGPHTWFKISYFQGLWDGQLGNGRLNTIQALGCLVAVLLMSRVWRLFGWGYTAYAAVVLAIPILGTDDFMGTGRYVLVAFPVLAAAGDLLTAARWRWVRPAAIVGCACLLVVMTVLYGRGIEVS